MEPDANRNGEATEQTVGETLYAFMKQGLFTDGTITVKGKHFPIHKAILSTKSSFFLNYFKRFDCLVTNDAEPEVFEKFLVHLYNGTAPNSATFSSQIIACAKHFGVEEIVRKFVTHFQMFPDAKDIPTLFFITHTFGWNYEKKTVMAYLRKNLNWLLSCDWSATLSQFDLVTEFLLSFPRVSWTQEDLTKPDFESKVAINWWFSFDEGLNTLDSFDVNLHHGTARFQIVMAERDNFYLVLLSGSCRYPLFLDTEFTLTSPDNQQLLHVSKVFTWFSFESDSLADRKFIFSHDSPRNFKLTMTLPTSPNQQLVEPLRTDEIPPGALKGLSTKFSDLRLKVKNRIFDAHRIILASKSPYFLKMFERSEKTYVLPGTSEEIFDIVLCYLYSGIFPKDELADFELLQSAKTFQLPQLFTRVETGLIRRLSPRNVISSLIAAHHLEANVLKTKALQMIKGNITSVVKSPTWQLLPEYPSLINDLLRHMA